MLGRGLKGVEEVGGGEIMQGFESWDQECVFQVKKQKVKVLVWQKVELICKDRREGVVCRFW